VLPLRDSVCCWCYPRAALLTGSCLIWFAGIAQFVSGFAERDDPEYAPPVPTCETRVCFWSLLLQLC
jgi:hypothetical protein